MKAASVILILVLAVGCGGGEERTIATSDTISPVAEPMATRTAVMADTESGATIVVVLEDNVIGMPLDGIAPGPVVFTIRNGGQQLHSFAIEGGQIQARIAENLAPGEESTLEVVFTPGSYRAWCPVHENVEGGTEIVEFQVANP
jgi:plastocyanin